MRIHSPAFNREKLSSVKADVESVEQETEANMHSLLLMDRNVVLHPPPPINPFIINEATHLRRQSLNVGKVQ